MSQGPARWRAWAPYVVAGALAVVLVTITATRADEPSAAEDVLGDKQLKIMAPADPGGGWDQTSRAMQAALEDLVGRSEVYNVGGAGGTIGLSQFAQLEGQQNQLMTTGLVMVGAIAANKPHVTLDEVTPLARLITDNQVIVVPDDSDIQTVDDLTKAMEADLRGVSIAGGSAGGVEQIIAGLLAQELGLDPADVNYIAHAGGGEAIATLLSGSATMGVSGISEIKPQIDAGALRPIAVTSEERVDILPDVPTLKEEGVDVVVTNWRGVVAPPGITEEQETALEDLIMEMTETDSWQEACEREGWGDVALAGPEFEEFLDQENKRIDEVIADLGVGEVS
jgi:putative tricarboxylic transport membrane protein